MTQLLGKQPYQHDPRTLMFGRYVDYAKVVPNLPESIPVPELKVPWGVMLNDSLGDCAIACPGHMTVTWTFDAGLTFVPTDQQVLQGYETQGYRPNDPSSDQGCVILNVLKTWQGPGLFGQKCGPYTVINTKDVTAMKTGVWFFGAIDMGFQLPLGAQGASQWAYDPATDTGPNWQGGSWGGHSVPIVGYDAGGAWVITWGAPLYVTWPFVTQFADEAWAVVSADYLKNGESPLGLNYQQLVADLADVTGSAPPQVAKQHWWNRLCTAA